jgi:NAD+ diphosphatase
MPDTRARRVGEVTLSDELALSRHAHDRLGNQRVDDEWIAARWEEATTRVMLLHRNTVAVDGGGERPVYVAPQEAPDGDRILLGWEGGTTYFAMLLPEPPEGLRMAGLREIGAVLEDRDAGLVTHAVALANWHRVHRHCPRCAGTLRSEQGGHIRRCEVCGRQQFPRTDPAVIMLVTDGHERCLLAHNAATHRERGYSTLAGFVEPGESLEAAVRREVAEEVGVRIGAVTYLGSQPWPFPSSLMLGFTAHAETTDVVRHDGEIAEARWYDRASMRADIDAGGLLVSPSISISRRLIEHWYGGPLPENTQAWAR